VKVRRRLRRVGAVPLRASVYLLPNVPDALEDFQWLRREIVAEGGEAKLCSAELVEGMSDAEAEEEFRRAREPEFARLAAAARAVGRAPSPRDLARLRRALGQVVGRDWFGAPGREAAERAVAEVGDRAAGRAPRAAAEGVEARPSGATWVTREGIFVDRIGSAWLIARFIDPAARFRFVPAKGHRPAPGELRFDMYEGEYTHEGDRCTFEVLLERFGLDDPALGPIAEIVHDIDLKDGKFGREEAEGVETVLRGIAHGHAGDRERLAAGRAVFEGLYEHFRRQA